MLLSLSCVVATTVCQAPVSADLLRLENRVLAVAIDPTNGAIVSVRNKQAGLELITHPRADQQPWLLLLDGNEFVSRIRQFRAVPRDAPDGQAIELQWTTDYDLVVQATLSLAEAGDQLEIRCAARNGGDRTILALNYPRFSGIGPLGDDGAADRVLHPATG